MAAVTSATMVVVDAVAGRVGVPTARASTSSRVGPGAPIAVLMTSAETPVTKLPTAGVVIRPPVLDAVHEYDIPIIRQRDGLAPATADLKAHVLTAVGPTHTRVRNAALQPSVPRAP